MTCQIVFRVESLGLLCFVAETNLRLLGANHPWTEAIKPLLEDFEGRTGTLESGAVGVSRGLFQEFPQAGRRPVA
jgi:hypothetical protein